MKLLRHLEKSRDIWYLLFAGILFFFLRFPSLVEPNWYGDEGIYQTIGLALNHGRILYSQIWDNKPPLLYILYAILQSDQFTIRLVSVSFGLGAIIALYLLAQKLFKNQTISLLSTILFAIIFALPFFEGNIANAENFMLLFTTLAGLLTYTASTNKKPSSKTTKSLTLAGLLLGIAFLFKIVALFDFLAFFLFLLYTTCHFDILAQHNVSKVWFLTLKSKLTTKSWASHNNLLFFTAAFILPMIFAALYFLSVHSLTAAFQAAFFGNIGYVSYGNTLIIPQGLLMIKFILLIIYLVTLFLLRQKLQPPFLFILLWLGLSLFNAFFSQRPYTHYILVTLPSLCLAIGLLIHTQKRKARLYLGIFLICIIYLLMKNFTNYGYKKTALYYQNFFQYITGQKTTESYQAFFDWKTPRDYTIAQFIKKHTKPFETIFLWGNSAQIYTLSQTLPPGRFTVGYHITQSEKNLQETARDLARTQPKYVIILSDMSPIPFNISTYNNSITIPGAAIYEKTF